MGDGVNKYDKKMEYLLKKFKEMTTHQSIFASYMPDSLPKALSRFQVA
jgi:hypothetical protein